MTLFSLAFPLTTPFWALMVLAPNWRWTARIMASPWLVWAHLIAFDLFIARFR